MNPLWADGLERGGYMTAFVSSQINLADSEVLDLGCGYGGISLAFAKKARRVVCVDHDPARLSELGSRVRSEGVTNIQLLRLDGRALPFESGRFDLVLLNGVLEYMGVNSEGFDPERLQTEALREIHRILRPNGLVYIGIENRNYPGYLNEDVHCGLPLVSMVPRSAANWISRLSRGRPFQHYIYSARGLTRLLRRAGYRDVDLYVPLFNYQYPIVYMRADDGGSVNKSLELADAAALSAEYHRMSFGRFPAAKRLLFKSLGQLGLMKLLCPCFVALARKSASVNEPATTRRELVRS